MYYQMPMYPVFICSQRTKSAQESQSLQILAAMSKVVGLKFQQFYAQKFNFSPNSILHAEIDHRQLNIAPSDIIQLSSSFSEKEENLKCNKKNSEFSMINHPTIPSSKVESQNLGFEGQNNKKNESVLLSELENKRNNVSINSLDQQFAQVVEEGWEECTAEEVEYKAVIPRMGIENFQILRRKQSLLQRKVNNWGELPIKKQKKQREIRMLHH